MDQTKGGFVLDCSITMAWCFDDEASPYSDGVRDLLADAQAVVPSLWSLEVVNAAIVGERRNRLDEARTRRFFALLSALPIVIDDESGRVGIAHRIESDDWRVARCPITAARTCRAAPLS